MTETGSGTGTGPGMIDEMATDRPVTARRRGPDVVMVVAALLTFAMAVAAFVGQVPDLSGFDPRWLLAAGAAAVGLLLLGGSVRGRRGSKGELG